MTSHAERLRIKRRASAGRPRKEGVERYPGGQIRHSETEKEVKAVAIEALKRVHGVDYHASGYSGYTLGRMFLDGKVTECERAAGDEYARHMSRYYMLTGVQFPSARAQDLHRMNGFGGETTPEQAKNAREAANKMMELEGVLLRLPDGPRVKTTVFNLCVLDLEGMRTMPDTQLAWLKRGLNELHWHLGLAKSRAAC